MNPPSPDISCNSGRILPWKKLHPGEGLLAWGLVFLAMTVVLIHFVMGWILAFMIAPWTLVLFLMGIIRARDGSAPAGRQWVGLGLLLPGIVALAVAAFMAASLSYKFARHAQTKSNFPELEDWTSNLGSSLITILLLCPGLWFWTNWSGRRCLVWCFIFLAAILAALLLHQILASSGGPLNAWINPEVPLIHGWKPAMVQRFQRVDAAARAERLVHWPSVRL